MLGPDPIGPISSPVSHCLSSHQVELDQTCVSPSLHHVSYIILLEVCIVWASPYIDIWDLLEPFTGCGPTVTVYLQKGQGSGCLVLDARCLCSSNLALESRRIPAELFVFSLCWNPEKVSSNKRQSGGKQAKSESPLFYVLSRGLLEGVVRM